MASAQLSTVLQHIRTLVATQAAADASDADLLERFVARRDENAFAILLKRHGPMVLRVGRRILGREHDAEDVFQATFLLFARKAGSIRKRHSVSSWLYGVAFRLAGRARAQSAHRKAHERQAASMRAAEPGTATAWQELQGVLEDVLAQLPEKYRAPLVLCYLEGKTQEQAAQQLGCPLGTVRSWLARGRTLLRHRLARRGVALSNGALAAMLIAEAASATTINLPATLVQPTLKAALLFAAGQEAAGLVTANVAGLVKGGVTAMVMAKLKAGTTLLIALAVLAAGTGVVAERVLGAKQPASTSNAGRIPTAKGAEPPKPEEEAQARTDAYGDPLPAGAIRRLGTLRFRQGGGSVNSLLLCPDGKTLVSNSFYGERAVCVWELATGKLLRQFPGNYDEKWIALSPDGRVVAVSAGAKIGLWDLASGEQVCRLKGEKVDGAHGLAFSPDGKTLAAGDQSGTIHFWDLTTGKPTARLPTQHNYRISLLAFSPDGKTLASADHLGNTIIQLWDAMSRKLLHQLTRPSDLYSLAFSPDGTTLVAGAGDGAIPLWDVRTGKLIRELRGWSHVRAVRFSPDGKILATGEFDDKRSLSAVALWDVATGGQVRHIEGGMGLLESIVFTADGKTVISSGGDSIIRLWDVATGIERAPVGNQGYVGCVTLSPDGRTLAYVNHNSIRLMEPTTGRELGALPSLPALSLAFSPDGKMLASGVYKNAIFLWDVGARKLFRRLDGDKENAGLNYGHFSSLAFSPDGRVLASGGIDAAVRFWDVATGKEVRRLALKDGANEFCTVEGVAFSPDGKTLAASGRAAAGGSKVRLWETATGKELPHLTHTMNASSGEPRRSFPESWEGMVCPRIIFSPDGRLQAMNRSQKTIPVWEVATGKERCLLQGHQESTVWVAFSPDGRTLASASWDNTIRLWDLQTSEELRQLTGHRGKANSLAFSADGKTLVSAGDDTTLLFWDVSGISQRPRPRTGRLSAKVQEVLWTALAYTDASKAYHAITTLSAAPEQTVPFLRRHLQPASTPEARQVARLIDDLDNTRFEVRQKATAELEKLGDLAEPALRKKLLDQPSPEARQRIEQLLDRLTLAGPERLRAIRAIEVLEQIGTPEARQVLETLAEGAPGVLLTREAAAAVQRLTKRPGRGN